MTTLDTSSAAFFEAKYKASKDPWNFAADRGELFRYERILVALGDRRVARAFEPGCSIGVLTEKLAGVAKNILATDLSATALERARERCRSFPHVAFRCESLADACVTGCDLVVLSEIGYYFDSAAWTSLSERLVAEMPPGGVMLASHWLGSSPDHRIGGDEVHSVLRANSSLHLTYFERHATFRLDVWSKL